MRCSALIMLFLLLLANMTISSRLPPTKRSTTYKIFIEPLKDVSYCMTVAAIFCFFIGIFLPLNFIQLAASGKAMPETVQQYIIPILNAVSIIGRVIPGYLADKVGRFNMQFVMAVLTCLLVLCLWLPSQLDNNAKGILAFAGLYGFSMGAFVTLVPAVIAQVSPDMSKIGVRQGTAFAIVSVATLIGNPIGGALINKGSEHLTGLIIFTGITQAFGALLILLAKFKISNGQVLSLI